MAAAALLTISVGTAFLNFQNLPLDHSASSRTFSPASTISVASAGQSGDAAASRSFDRAAITSAGITTAQGMTNDYVDADGYKDFPEESLKLSQAYKKMQDQRKKLAAVSSATEFTLPQFMSKGVVRWGGHKFTYYSQSVLPGGGLNIPGRHVNSAGYVVDSEGYIVLAGSAAIGTVYATPFGAKGKVYDRGVVGNHLDVYIR